MTENRILHKNILYTKDSVASYNFCLKVITDCVELENHFKTHGQDFLMYMCGDIKNTMEEISECIREYNKSVLIINELSSNCTEHYYDIMEEHDFVKIDLLEVPVNIKDMGIFVPRFFEKNYYSDILASHNFQNLRESDKETVSYRKGIYLSKVEKDYTDPVGIRFNLLRCSTNLDGPTENFRPVDTQIITTVNEFCDMFYEQKIQLNHVLAQVYNNVQVGNKEKKAKIKEHSDKTKDMPRNALMVFCTFYSDDTVSEKQCTILRFRSKEPENIEQTEPSEPEPSEPEHIEQTEPEHIEQTESKKFDVILYPGSIFVMSLESNRLYTHEIIPSGLNISKLPTRLGYVIRCSCVEAVYKDSKVYLNDQVLDENPTPADISNLKALYKQENGTTSIIDYPDINFSLNKGDYTEPNM